MYSNLYLNTQKKKKKGRAEKGKLQMRRSWLAFVILLSSSLLDVKLLATQPVSLIFWLFQLSHVILF